MKTRKITVFAIAAVLGALTFTGCGEIVGSSSNTADQPAAQVVQTVENTAELPAAQQQITAGTEQAADTAAVIPCDTADNSFDYTQQSGNTAQEPQYQAATSAEQTAAQNALAYAGGNGYKIISTETVQTSDGSTAYRFGIVPADNDKAPAWYYVAGENFAMTEGEWINQKDELTKEEWEIYYDSAEHRYAIAYQTAVQNAIAVSGIEDALAVSCDFVDYDYDKLQYAFKVGIRPMDDPDAPVSYFMAGTDYAVEFESWGK